MTLSRGAFTQSEQQMHLATDNSFYHTISQSEIFIMNCYFCYTQARFSKSTKLDKNLLLCISTQRQKSSHKKKLLFVICYVLSVLYGARLVHSGFCFCENSQRTTKHFQKQVVFHRSQLILSNTKYFFKPFLVVTIVVELSNQ